MSAHESFTELALLLLVAAAAGALALRLRQPVLIAYVAVGIVVGPSGLGLVASQDQVALLSQIGIAVLLFLVGLKLDLRQVRHIGPVALATGLGQLTFTVAIGFVLVLALGRGWLTALYVAIALTFSSTIIIVKLLSDKRELDALHGRIAVGFLIVQDIAVVLAMMAMSALGGGDSGDGVVLASIVGRVVLAAALLYLLMRNLLPPVVRLLAGSQELLLVFAIAWGTALAALGEWAGFSREAGAFLAGFSLASTPYRDAMSARLSGVRDFLLLFFFVDLGARLDLSTLGGELWPAALLSAFVLIGNPLIVMAIMGYMGYRSRTGFLAGLTVAQISEFSIIFVAMGISMGHIENDALGLVTLVGLVTIAISTYMILYSHPLYDRLAPLFGVFERRQPYRELAMDGGDAAEAGYDVVVLGIGRYGERLLRRLQGHGVRALGVDFDPEAVRRLRRQGLSVIYGDAEDDGFLEAFKPERAKWIVSSLPGAEANRSLLEAMQALPHKPQLAAVARDALHEQRLREMGLSRIINPFHDAADHAARSIADELQQTPGDA